MSRKIRLLIIGALFLGYTLGYIYRALLDYTDVLPISRPAGLGEKNAD